MPQIGEIWFDLSLRYGHIEMQFMNKNDEIENEKFIPNSFRGEIFYVFQFHWNHKKTRRALFTVFITAIAMATTSDWFIFSWTRGSVDGCYVCSSSSSSPRRPRGLGSACALLCGDPGGAVSVLTLYKWRYRTCLVTWSYPSSQPDHHVVNVIALDITAVS